MNRIIKNASWIIAGKVFQAVVNIVVSMITARYLGPSNYGLLTYASSIVMFILPVVKLGLDYILVQELIENPRQSGCTIGTATVATLASSVLGVFGILAFTLIVNGNERDTVIVVALYSLSLFFHMTEMIQYWYQAQLLSKYVAIVSLISRISVSIYKIYIVISGKSIYWFAVVNSIDYFLISLLLFVLYFFKGGERIFFSFEKAKEILSKSKHFIIAGLMVSIFSQTDRIMLKLMINDAESGFYSAAVTCAGMSSFLFAAVIESFRPVVFESKMQNAEQYKKNTLLLYSIIIYMALFQSVALTMLAKPIIYLLYGSDYSAAVPVLQLVTWYSAFSYLGSARVIWFQTENKQQYVWLTNLLGAVVNVIGNSILIPIYGARGAAIASVGTQILTNFLINFVLRPIRENGMWILEALNPKIICNTFAHKH